MTEKEQIIELFRKYVKGKKPDVSQAHQRHDGKEGHWLEQQFKIKANASNSADILGYELKNSTNSKTTFGDWSANEYVFTSKEYSHLFLGNTKHEKKDYFCALFGKANAKKNNRFSWSGSPCPTIHKYNDFGQKLIINDNNDIIAIYSYSKDIRPNKALILPSELQIENLVLARWHGETSAISKSLKSKLEDKFNQSGWFTCKKDENGCYSKICFGNPINFENWIKLVKKGIVFFDSGMYQGNDRPYSQWRANNDLWDSLVVECYE